MTTVITSQADVATDKPGPYLRQLCKHFGHKVEASYEETTGQITFQAGRCELEALEGVNTLRLTVFADAQADVEHVREVVGIHLERFGRRDGLSVSWR